jgi:hypothetical protein
LVVGGGAWQSTYGIAGLAFTTDAVTGEQARVKVSGPLRISRGMNQQTQQINRSTAPRVC